MKLKFLYAPEIVKKGDIILLREGRTKVLGTIVEVGGEEKQEEKIVKKKIEPAFGWSEKLWYNLYIKLYLLFNLLYLYKYRKFENY